MRMSVWVLVLSFFFAFALKGSEVYKWVDENGVVHYTDNPPRDEQSIKVEVQDKGSQADTTQGESVYRDVIEQQRIRRRELEAVQEQKAQERKAEREKASKSEANCSRAIHYLNTLKRQCPVFYDGAGILRAQCPGYYSTYEGDRTYIEDDEREELIEHYERVVLGCSELYR